MVLGVSASSTNFVAALRKLHCSRQRLSSLLRLLAAGGRSTCIDNFRMIPPCLNDFVTSNISVGCEASVASLDK